MALDILDQEITEEYALYNGDSAQVMQTLPDESVHLSIYSPPFCSAADHGLYQYSSSQHDLSNSRNPEEFFQHYEYIVRQIYRVTLPGRLSGVHCIDVPSNGANLGGDLIDFPGDIIRLHKRLGFFIARGPT